MILDDIEIGDDNFELMSNASGDNNETYSNVVDPALIAGAIGSVGDAIGSVSENRNQDKLTLKAVCGRRPGLFSRKSKKADYQKCIDKNVGLIGGNDSTGSRTPSYQPQIPPQMPPSNNNGNDAKSGLSTGATIVIVVGVIAVLGVVGFLVVKSKK